ncbi:MAG: 16S rRNA (adenine(1518)-N(6)/adenine(1519)-N(6))-dimethyltransferase RsmA [Desulfobacteraceae bacterium]
MAAGSKTGKLLTGAGRPQGPGKGFRAKKGLGQHFLVDHGVVDAMLTLAGFGPQDTVLEVGPGQGVLTLPLARRVGAVIAVEKDAGLIRPLKDRLFRKSIFNVTLLHQDILSFDLEQTPGTWEKLHIMGNLPYNISTPFMDKLIRSRDVLGRAVLMFQSEVAQRLTASPHTKAYGAMTVMVQYFTECTSLMAVPRWAFYPRPKVDSMVVGCDFQRPYPRRALNERLFEQVVRSAFAYRRKMLINSLKGFHPEVDRKRLLTGMRRCGIDPQRRAETLDMEAFLCLTSALAIDTPVIE